MGALRETTLATARVNVALDTLATARVGALRETTLATARVRVVLDRNGDGGWSFSNVLHHHHTTHHPPLEFSIGMTHHPTMTHHQPYLCFWNVCRCTFE